MKTIVDRMLRHWAGRGGRLGAFARSRALGRAATALCMVCATVLLSAQSFTNSYAVVVGIDDYHDPSQYPHLDYPVKDAQAIAKLMKDQGFTVQPFYGQDAKKAAILSYLEGTLARKLEGGDRVVFFFAGHGATDDVGGEKRGFIVPWDGDDDASLISMEDLRKAASYMGNARHLLFLLDSCYGGLIATKDRVLSSEIPSYMQEISRRLAREALTAGGPGQPVLDSDGHGHSPFVDALLEGLRDGMADLNGDGWITFPELVAYVEPRASNDQQTPGPGYLPGHQMGEFWFKSPRGKLVPDSPIAVAEGGVRRATGGVPAEQAITPAGAAALRAPTIGLTAQQHIAAGDAYYNARAWEPAAAEYTEAIRLDPRSAEAHWDLGLTKGNRGDWDGQIAEEKQAIRLKPDYPEAHYSLGVAYSWKNNWDGEIGEQREAVRLKPDYAEAHYALGVAYGEKDNWDGTIAEEKEAIRLKPDYPEAHWKLGVAYSYKDDWDRDIAEQKEAIRLKPEYAEAHHSLGVAYGEKDNWDGTIAEEKEAIRLKPDYPEAHWKLGVAYSWKDNWDGEIAEQKEAIRLKPDYADAHYRLGVAYSWKDNWDGEIAEEKEAIRLDPDYAKAHYSLGVAYGEKGNWDATITEEKEAIRLKPDYPEAHWKLGVAYWHKGDWDGDISEQKAAIHLKPDYFPAHKELGVAYWYKKDYESAISEQKEAIRLKPDDAGAHFELGHAYEMLARNQDALAEYQKALSLDPGNKSYLDGISREKKALEQ